MDRLAPDGEAAVALDVRVRESFRGTALPLVLRVDAEGFGRILQWDLPVALDGSPSVHEAPVLRVSVPARASAGEAVMVDLAATDDEEVAHVCVYLNGRKVAFVPGERPAMEARVPIVLEAGGNAVVVRAEDRDGRAAVASAWVLGPDGP